MMEWEPVYRVAALGFAVGIVFGAVANKTNFCTMGAVSDWVNMGSKDRLRAWFLAIGIAIIATRLMDAGGLIDIDQSIYRTSNFGWLGHVIGGFLFGVGMTLASGCGQRTLVRLGGGNLKSLVVVLLLAISAYMTLRGLLALVRINAIEVANIDLTSSDIPGQGIDTLLAAAAGAPEVGAISWAVAIVLGLAAISFAFAGKTFRSSFDNILAGIVVGLAIPAGWYITGAIGQDDFDPVRLESYTFIAPTGESLMFLLTFTGSTISFGVAAVGGIILGSFLYVIMTGKFRVETFSDRSDMLRHIVGGIAMGFGGVLALGCTIGQGVTGMSTLALGSLLSLVSIIFGSALTMKIEYHRLDGLSFLAALRQSLAEMYLFPSNNRAAD